MNSTLKQTTLTMMSANMRGESSLPALSNVCFWHRSGNTNLPEEDGLFVGYGHVPSPFPYRMQDMYTRELYETKVNAVVLENEHLKATFLPDWGGKLMSLFDKDAGRELLSVNPVLRPCNLAIRNAWTSGGVEWNCGFFGHNVHTCERLFTAVTKFDDGTPVLRMYEFERIRRVVKQMDFFIPEGSRFMFARMRIINPLYDVVPMYWWSNIAVPETKGCRVIVNADGAYVQENNISLVNIPEHDGFDGTRPCEIPNAMDHFYKIPDRARKYEAQLDADGYGLIQTSTSLLKGRKLFAWGQGTGGDRWQEYLTEDGSDLRYTEIQAGLASSQYECVPMPPKTTWEWLEAYGAMSADPAVVHGDDWAAAKNEVATKLEAMIGEEELENMLDATRPMAKRRADAIIFEGSGWCALENIRRERSGEALIAPHLDFGAPGREQEDWLRLMNEGTTGHHDPADVPNSWMLQGEFVKMLESAVKDKDAENWYTYLELGAAYCATGYEKLQDAYNCFEKSFDLTPSAWAMYGFAMIAKLCGNNKDSAEKMMKASKMMPGDESLAKEAMASLVASEMYGEVMELAKALEPELLSIGRIKLYLVIASIKLGDLEYAESVLRENGGLVVADIREGENIITNIYLDLEEAKAKEAGLPFDRNECEVPAIFDYRTSQKKKK
ncbi:MAG: DUF5107 domain-containing protein [Clostridia bacterium]|nr:DUF5107 domain-containing protein [Clostridia bacterium]